VLGSFEAETAAAAIEAAIRSAGYASLEDMRRAFGWNVELEAAPACPSCGAPRVVRSVTLRDALAALLNELRDIRALGTLDAEDAKGYDFAGVIADAERVLGEPDPDAHAAAGELAEAARLDAEAADAETCPRCESAACDGGCALRAADAAPDFCEVCEVGAPEWVAPIGGGGGVRACSACVDCHASDRMEPGVTWTRIDGRAKQTDGLVVLVNGADAARKEG